LNTDGVAKDELQAIRFDIPGPHILLGRRQRRLCHARKLFPISEQPIRTKATALEELD
jgi:hypothetical protein